MFSGNKSLAVYETYVIMDRHSRSDIIYFRIKTHYFTAAPDVL